MSSIALLYFALEPDSSVRYWFRLGRGAKDPRWHVTPREAGRKRLQLIISARTVSADGLAAETALPDQVITVRVRTNYAKVAGRWIGWGVAAIAGGLLAKFGEGAFAAIGKMIAG